MEMDGQTVPGGLTFPRGRGSNCIILYIPIEFVIFQGAGVPTPAPPLDPRVASLAGFVHTSSWPKDRA